jgi:hypothetical protein
MVRLGFQLTLSSGREALVRALMIAVAVAVGVTVLLAVFADYHAYEATSNRACWECTKGARTAPHLRARSFGTTARTYTRAGSSSCSTWPLSGPRRQSYRACLSSQRPASTTPRRHWRTS